MRGSWGITHSLLATGFIAAVSLPIGYFLGNWLTAITLPLGHLLACFSDCFTKQGVQLFFPDPAWAISVSNPKYLSGSLTVDFPEEVKLPILPDQYQTVSLSGAAVNLEYCGIEGAIAVLKEQYVVGTITAKVIQPNPNFNWHHQ